MPSGRIVTLKGGEVLLWNVKVMRAKFGGPKVGSAIGEENDGLVNERRRNATEAREVCMTKF